MTIKSAHIYDTERDSMTALLETSAPRERAATGAAFADHGVGTGGQMDG